MVNRRVPEAGNMQNASFHCVQTAQSQFERSSKAHFCILPASGTLLVGTPINWERIWGWRQEVSTYSLISFFNYIFPCFHSFQFDKLTG